MICAVDGTVQLMHQTAGEFLLQITQHTRGSQFDQSSQKAHGVIATTSIRYLMLCLGNPCKKAATRCQSGWVILYIFPNGNSSLHGVEP